MKKKILSVILSVMIILAVMPLSSVLVSAAPIRVNHILNATEFRNYIIACNDPTNQNHYEALNGYIQLRTDIDWNDVIWPDPANTMPQALTSMNIAEKFYGIFDGNGHTIYNYTGKDGLFECIGYGGKVVDLNMKVNSISGVADSGVPGFSNLYAVGAIANYCQGAIMDCHVYGTGNKYIQGSGYVGGIVGYLGNPECPEQGQEKFGQYYDANTAIKNSPASITNSTVSSLNISSVEYNTQGITTGTPVTGGVVGAGYSAIVENCSTSSDVLTVSNGYAGGIIGAIDYNVIVRYCSNKGTVLSNQDYDYMALIMEGGIVPEFAVGGIVGHTCFNQKSSSSSQIIDCGNYGNVTGMAYVGGIVGCADAVGITNCKVENNSSDISTTVSGAIYVGGIIGGNMNQTVNILNSYSNAIVSTLSYDGAKDVGGIAGLVSNGTVINSHSTGNVLSGAAGSSFVNIGAAFGEISPNVPVTAIDQAFAGNTSGYPYAGNGWVPSANCDLYSFGSSCGGATINYSPGTSVLKLLNNYVSLNPSLTIVSCGFGYIDYVYLKTWVCSVGSNSIPNPGCYGYALFGFNNTNSPMYDRPTLRTNVYTLPNGQHDYNELWFRWETYIITGTTVGGGRLVIDFEIDSIFSAAKSLKLNLDIKTDAEADADAPLSFVSLTNGGVIEEDCYEYFYNEETGRLTIQFRDDIDGDAAVSGNLFSAIFEIGNPEKDQTITYTVTSDEEDDYSICNISGVIVFKGNSTETSDNHVRNVMLSSEKAILGIGDSFELSVNILPETAENKNVTWRSLDTKVAKVENGVVTALRPGSTVISVQTDDGGLKDFCYVRVVSLNTIGTAILDYDNDLIYGLTPGLNTLDGLVQPIDDSMSVILSTDSVGTGTLVNVVDNGLIIDSYEAVIFGDVNGDGWYDGTDSIIVNCLANGILSREQVGEAVYMAADCNHDDVIDSFDVDILQQAGILLASVDQTKSEAELLETNSAYVEYLNLIDQTVETETTEVVEEEPTVPEIEPARPEPLIFRIVNAIALIFWSVVNFFTNLFD